MLHDFANCNDNIAKIQSKIPKQPYTVVQTHNDKPSEENDEHHDKLSVEVDDQQHGLIVIGHDY